MPLPTDPRVLVGHGTHDDAGVYLVRPDLAVVTSIDVFGPVVDDPYQYGQITAANALGDLYAMGVEPAFALAFGGFPTDVLDDDTIAAILIGGADKVAEAGATIIGGHTIRDAEPKYGLAVTGFAHPDAILTNARGRVGDALVLTKPIGTGVITHGIKHQLVSDEAAAEAIALMAALNRGACAAAVEVGVNAVTDVTGFGLLGHLREVCVASGVGARIHAPAVPVLEAARALATAGTIPGGTKRNLAWAEGFTTFDAAIGTVDRLLLADAQTSGGLLISVAADKVDRLMAAMAGRTLAAAVIGELTSRRDGVATIEVL